MGCNTSKKKKGDNKENSNPKPMPKDNDMIKSQLKEVKGEAWEEVTPLQAPYPDGEFKLEDVIKHEDIHNDSLNMPVDEVIGERQEGFYVEAK